MKLHAKSKAALMSKKYFSMLAGGTLTMMVASIMLMSDSFIAGAFIGSDAVAAITLVTPLYSLAVFFGSVISILFCYCFIIRRFGSLIIKKAKNIKKCLLYSIAWLSFDFSCCSPFIQGAKTYMTICFFIFPIYI